MAQTAQRTARVTPRPVEPALIGHAKVAEREVVLDRIGRVQLAQRGRDVGGHLPPGTRVSRQSKAPPYTNHVRVERDDQPGRPHLRPESEIDRVAPDHPAQKQVEPLARTTARGP